MRTRSPRRRPRALLLAALAVAAAGITAAGADSSSERPPAEAGPRSAQPVLAPPPTARPSGARTGTRAPRRPRRASRALGSPNAGRLVAGVRLPRAGRFHVTWDPVRWRSPNRAARLHGTDRLVRTVLRVARAYATDNPGAARIVVGDLSRPHGGDFGARAGALGEFGARGAREGHASHQNGLDVDVYYPRRDRAERAPDALADIDRRLAQDLVDRFVAAGARFVFVGPRTGIAGPPGVVQPLVRHDDHLHVRLPAG